MADDLITSTSNPLVRRLRKLRHRKFREAEGAFLVEGIAQVRQAVEHAAPIEQLLVAPDLLKSQGAWDVVAAEGARGTTVVSLGREAFESIVERDHPSGLAATVHMQERALAELHARPGSFYVALLDVGNPGNLGSIIRTIDAVGGHGLVIVGDSTDQFHPVAVKASMGTLFSVPVFRAPDVDSLIAWCLMEEVTFITTSVRAPENLWEAKFELPSLFLFGSEALGLPSEVLGRSAVSISMPMEGAASSLNLSVAVGVMLYEIKRRSIG